MTPSKDLAVKISLESYRVKCYILPCKIQILAFILYAKRKTLRRYQGKNTLLEKQKMLSQRKEESSAYSINGIHSDNIKSEGSKLSSLSIPKAVFI